LEWIDLAQGGSDVCWVPSRHEGFFEDGTIEFLAEPLRAHFRARFGPAADTTDESEASADARSRASTTARSRHNLSKVAVPSAAAARELTDGGLATGRRFFSPGVCSLKHTLLTSLPLTVADGAAATASLALSAGMAALIGFPVGSGLVELLLAVVASLLAVFLFAGLYPGVGLHAVVELRKIGSATTLVFALCLVAARVEYASAIAMLLISWPLVIAAVPLARAAIRWLCADSSWWGHRVVILGTGPAGQAVYRHLRENPTIGLRPLGLLDDRPLPLPSTGPVAYLGPLANAATIAAHEGIPWAIVAMPEKSSDEVLRVVTRCADCFPHLLVVPDTAGLPTLWIDAHQCGGLPAWRMTERLLLPLPRLTKRLTDLAAIVICGPMLLAIVGMVAALIKMGSPGPVFYCQRRIGRGGKHFYAWKFRSMVCNADSVLEQHLATDPALRQEWNRDHKLRNDPRVTRIGRFLRKTSIDELPQLWNVLKGEMSLVGPRPIVDAEVTKYGKKFELYSKVTPGITGLWQISGRNDTTYGERVALDAFYARNWSCWLDLFILACTVRTVVSRSGAY
jgi:Undecaprenyl-phosphate galactose phosphotransferase WbaP